MLIAKPNSMTMRWFAAPLFVLGGGVLMLTSMLGAPSFWYVPCFCGLIIVGIIWTWKPRVAAALSIGPLISVAVLLRYLSGLWLGLALLSFLFAALLVIASLNGFRGSRTPMLLSLVFLFVSFATDRLFTNRVTVKTYQMEVALDGKAPWGEVGPQWSDGSAPVLVYRRVGSSYCYDGFQSQELRDRLAAKKGQTVTVEYNVFRDFGKEHSYNVRSVDGLLLANGQRVVRDFERFGGQILGSESTSADYCR